MSILVHKVLSQISLLILFTYKDLAVLSVCLRLA